MVLISDFLWSENLIRDRHIFPTNVFCNVITFKQIRTRNVSTQYENIKNQEEGEEKRKGQTERDSDDQH